MIGLNKFYNIYVASIVSIIGRRIEAHCRNQPNKSSVVLYNPLL